MIIKNITGKSISPTASILPFKKNNVFPIKINKSIEIVVVPNFGDINAHQDNVGIILEEQKILKILSKKTSKLKHMYDNFFTIFIYE